MQTEKLEFCDPHSFLVEAVEGKGPRCTTAFPDPGGASKQDLKNIYETIVKVFHWFSDQKKCL